MVQDIYRSIHTVGVPFVIALVELTKRSFPQLPRRAVPAISIFWGIVLYVASAYLDGRPLDSAALDGVFAGLVAVGLVEVSKLPLGSASGEPSKKKGTVK